MPSIRQLHLYLGCLFAPLLIFFAVTGAYQTFELHEATRPPQAARPTGAPSGERPVGPPPTAENVAPGYRPYGWVEALASVHKHQKLPGKVQRPAARVAVQIVILLMALGLVTSTGLGVWMAFLHIKKRRQVWACLLAGVVVPLLLVALITA